MPNSKRREKNEAFRCLYGFGVLFILLSHCGGGGVSFLNNWVNFGAFHVAVFLLGSGYFFDDDEALRPGKWFVKKLKKLILPLFLWNVFYGIIIIMNLRNKEHNPPHIHAVSADFVAPFLNFVGFY